ncbi:MAG: TolC family outer membrane protein [Proteobacteria bacterium]|nr:TolC family outer membrane protein [Pseudomonadota bacterium]
MNLRIRTLPLAVLLAIGCAGAQAGDLQQAYDMARQSDPQLAAAAANQRAGEAGVGIARSALLPQVGATASLTKTSGGGHQDTSFPCGAGTCFGRVNGSSDTTTRTTGISVQQSVVNISNYESWKASKSLARQGDAQFENASQTLITRVAQAYFNVLSAIQDLASSRAQERALKRQYDQANVRLQVGLAPITDMQEAKAQYDIARAQTISFQTALSDAREALREITGQPLDHLKGLAADFNPTAPTPGDAEAWVKMAVDQNPQVIAQQRALDAADQSVDAARAAHLPTLNFSANYGDTTTWGSSTSAGTGFPVASVNYGPSYSLTLTVPIFAGFGISSRVDQAIAARDGAADSLEQTRRAVERQARATFNATMGGIIEIQARKQALLSAQTALEATQTGLEVGTRTIVDVLINEQQLFSAQRDYARARNNFVVNGLLLKQAAGNVQASDVAAVNALLVTDAEAALDTQANDSDTTMPGLPSQPAKAAAPTTQDGAPAKPAPKARHHLKKATTKPAAAAPPVTP